MNFRILRFLRYGLPSRGNEHDVTKVTLKFSRQPLRDSLKKDVGLANALPNSSIFLHFSAHGGLGGPKFGTALFFLGTKLMPVRQSRIETLKDVGWLRINWLIGPSPICHTPRTGKLSRIGSDYSSTTIPMLLNLPDQTEWHVGDGPTWQRIRRPSMVVRFNDYANSALPDSVLSNLSIR